MDFVSVDLETANANMASVCQIGLAGFEGGRLVAEWSSLVDPEDFFDAINISIHGITEADVLGRPTLPEVFDEVESWLESRVVVSHTHFDRVAFLQAFRRYELESPSCTWLDSARVARRAWSECSSRGYGLRSVCDIIGYDFTHHDALEDAKAAGHVMLAAVEATGLSVSDWLERVKQPIDPHSSRGEALARDGDPNGPMHGEVMVFTGALEIPRREATDIAAALGCRVDSGVTRRTTLLVVGDQDVSKLAGHSKSSKHRKAEQLIEAGCPIRILPESDFQELANVMQNGA